MIDRSTIERIIDATDIVDVIQDFVSLKKRGVNYIGCCPFHNEKTPSFIVSPAKGIFKCFGCGKSGNAVGFVMEHEQFTYPEALKYLACKYNIDVVEKELTQEEQQGNDDRESMRILNSFAAKYFQNNLLNTDEGIAIGLSYFRERGFTDEVINTFGLGYSLEKSTALTDEALSKGYKLDFLARTGLTIINSENQRKYDRFFGRAMFPIHNISGQIIGFGGRTLRTNDKTAKYVNSPESEVYNKRKTLYGIYQARTEIVRQKKCYLVEGYADVISMHIAGIKNVVASSGTSLTVEQTQMLRRLTEDVTVLYDGDSAGIHASLRGIDMLLEQGLNIRIVLLPDGEDPDSFAKANGSEKTIAYLNDNEEDFIRFKSKLSKKETEKDPLKRAATITDMVKTISLIDDRIKQTVYIQECSKILEIDENTLYNELAKYRKKRLLESKQQKNTETSTFTANDNSPIAESVPVKVQINDRNFAPKEREILRILLLYGNREISNPLDKSENPQNIKVCVLLVALFLQHEIQLRDETNQKIFAEITQAVLAQTEFSDKTFINHCDLDIAARAADLCSENYELSTMWTKHGVAYYKEEHRLSEIVIDMYQKYMTEIHKEEKKIQTNELKNTMLQVEQLRQKLAIEQDETQRLILQNEFDAANERTSSILKRISEINTEINDLSLKQGRVSI